MSDDVFLQDTACRRRQAHTPRSGTQLPQETQPLQNTTKHLKPETQMPSAHWHSANCQSSLRMYVQTNVCMYTQTNCHTRPRRIRAVPTAPLRTACCCNTAAQIPASAHSPAAALPTAALPAAGLPVCALPAAALPAHKIKQKHICCTANTASWLLQQTLAQTPQPFDTPCDCVCSSHYQQLLA